MERLELLSARAGREGGGALRRDREGRAGGRCRPSNAHLRRHAVALPAGDDGLQGIARLRLAGLLLDTAKYDEALKQLDEIKSPEFVALAADRRGDVLLAQGKSADAQAAYLKAWAAMDPKLDYRRLIEAKLNLLGVQPAAAAASGAEAAK